MKTKTVTERSNGGGRVAKEPKIQDIHESAADDTLALDMVEALMATKKFTNPRAGTTVQVEMPDLQLGEATIEIKGTSPFLCNKFSEKAKKQIEDKQKGTPRNKKMARDPEAEFEAAQYNITTDKNGDPLKKPIPAIPACMFKKSFVNACSFVDGITKVAARGAMHVVGDLLPLEGVHWVMDARPVRIGRMGSQVTTMAYRPITNSANWRVMLHIRWNENMFTLEQITNLFVNAGFAVGVGEWRPQKDGSMGMFTVGDVARIKREGKTE